MSNYLPPTSRMRGIKRSIPARKRPSGLQDREDTNSAAPAVEDGLGSIDEAIAKLVPSEEQLEPVEGYDPEPPEFGDDGAATRAPDTEMEEFSEFEDDDTAKADMAMTRSELNARAREEGIRSPKKLPSKQAVLDAILAAREDG